MEQIDLLILLLLGLGFIIGLFKGFFKQVISVICIVAGIVVGRVFSPMIASTFDESYYAVAYGISFLILFLIVALLGILVSKSIKAILKTVNLSWIDRLGGGLVGAFKYLILAGLMINIIEIFGFDQKLFPQDIAQKSMFYNISKKSLGYLMPFVDGVTNITEDIIEETGLKD